MRYLSISITLSMLIALTGFLQATSHAETVEVAMRDSFFDSQSVTVNVGDIVKWANQGLNLHTSTSGTNCSPDGKWDSGFLSTGASFETQFNEPGTFSYFCTLHCSLGMTGTIVVLSASSLTISPPSGKYVTNQGFDLTLIVEASGVSITGGSLSLDGSDITSSFAACIIPGTLVSGGQTLRCPGIKGETLGAGTHTLAVTLDLSDGTSVSDTVAWEIKENTE